MDRIRRLSCFGDFYAGGLETVSENMDGPCACNGLGNVARHLEPVILRCVDADLDLSPDQAKPRNNSKPLAG